MLKKPNKPERGRIEAYAQLPDFMFEKHVDPYMRWCVELMYMIHNVVKDGPVPADMGYFLKDAWMTDNAYMFTVREGSLAMESFLANLDEIDAKVPPDMLEPLIAIAGQFNIDLAADPFASTCRRLRDNAKDYRVSKAGTGS